MTKDRHDHPLHRETIAASHGVATDPAFGAVAPPLYLSTTYEFAGFDRARQYDYGRAGNPTRDLLCDALAQLEGGAGAVVTSSGMAAIDLVLGQLSGDDLVIAPYDCYGGTMRLLKARAARRHFQLAFVDQSDLVAVSDALGRGAAMLFVETPSNPLMRIVDIAALCRMAHAVGAQVAVDNTFLSPAVQRPLALGADYVVHSTTKFLNGHSDVIGGAVIAAQEQAAASLKQWCNVIGTAGSPFDAWLTLRGLRSLFARMREQQSTAMVIAEFLHNHPAVAKVHYPGLTSHGGHELAGAQQTGFGAMLSFELAGGEAAVRRFVAGISVLTLAESLGGVESLIAHPATMTHADMGKEARQAAGIEDNLLRLSVGLEHRDDLLADLGRALEASADTTIPLCRHEELARAENALRKER
ncbi:cystathionine gamma-synthase [Novosphingobium sediminicola]|uniref:L-methionine gamma-lyase n=1 Tax=Novosphingobium sediminicola TaxID=563162 RepID=A0A7W6G9N6_9SPHN|nr:cystathionine gamma-synthase [Novosphingobium sediminicola]MBB3957252.1 cystathionine gamma-synthase [Novosphingobium sediminicola]